MIKKLCIVLALMLVFPCYAARKLTTNEATILLIDNLVAVGDGVTPLTDAIVETAVTVELLREYDDGSIPTLVTFAPTAAGVGTNDLSPIISAATSTTGAFGLEITAAQINFTGYLTVTLIDTDVMLPWSRRFIVTTAAMVDADYGGTFQHVLLADTDHVINHLTIDDDTSDAFVVISRSAGGHAIKLTGNDSGSGLFATGGAIGEGATFTGGGGATGPFHAILATAGTAGYGFSGTIDITTLASMASAFWTASSDTAANKAAGTMGRYAGRKGR